ncbi:MAG TPA: FAD synthetase family protein [Sphaerochaeta sp.]|nr:FAD synthetase family protein [Sphaerochaeta sp.]
MRRFDFMYLVDTPLLTRQEMVVSVGVFDGVHLGHQAIIERNVALAKAHGYQSMVITFNKNPKMVKGNQENQASLTSEVQFEELLAEMGVDYLLVIDFSSDFSTLSAEEFLILITRICTVKMMVVGADFRCGVAGSSAGPVQLQEHLAQLAPGASVEVPPFVTTTDGVHVSSTQVRQKLSQGALDKVQSLLGRPYELDLAAYPSKSTADGLLYRTRSFAQLLPPLGEYSACLTNQEGKSVGATAIFESEQLRLRLDEVGGIEASAGTKRLGVFTKRSSVS